MSFQLCPSFVDNGFEDLWRRENPESSEFTRYDRSSGTRSRIGRVYSDKKMLAIPRLITQWYPLLIIIMIFLLKDSPQKLKLEMIHGTLIISVFIVKTQKKATTLQQVTGENTPNFV